MKTTNKYMITHPETGEAIYINAGNIADAIQEAARLGVIKESHVGPIKADKNGCIKIGTNV